MKRKKRLEKGIESIQEQIEFHEQKKEEAKLDGSLELEGYYKKEIEGLKKTKERKQEQLDKQ